jgi:hypothetical protein
MVTQQNGYKSNLHASSRVVVFLQPFLKCFSLRDNINFIFNTNLNQKSIRPIHGIRAVAATWIMVGHLFYYAYGTWDNLELIFIHGSSWILQPFFVAQCFTDSFLAMR